MQNPKLVLLLHCCLFYILCVNGQDDSSSSSSENSVEPDARSLEQIYRAALDEQAMLDKNAAPLIVYAGGTGRGQLDDTARDFARRFPNLTVNIVVDFSTFHGPRVDVQLANNSLIPDLIQLQTLEDFPRWKRQGVLMQYKPANWSNVHSAYRDEDGFYIGGSVLVASTMVNSQLLPRQQWPKSAMDLLKPEFADGKMALLHPKMDNVVLFLFKQIVDKYGYNYLTKFAAQKPVFVCDSGLMSGNASTLVDPAGAAFVVLGNDSVPQMAPFPPANNDPFTTLAMYMAIFNQTKRPEAAKLFLNWALEKEHSNNVGNIWSVRTDVPPKQGFKQIWEYNNSNHQAFAAYMADYRERERFSKQFALFLGEAKCNQSPVEQRVNVP